MEESGPGYLDTENVGQSPAPRALHPDTENVGQSPAPVTKGQNASGRLTGPFELCHLSNPLIHPISAHKEIILAERVFLQQPCCDNGHFNFCPILAGCA